MQSVHDEVMAGEPKMDENTMRQRENQVRREFWGKLKRTLARIPFAEQVVAAYYCALDPATPTRARAIMLGGLVYFLLPFDIVPDFILALGFIDDAAVVMAAVRAVSENLRPEHYAKARAALDALARDEEPLSA